jgi:hypothetical protein
MVYEIAGQAGLIVANQRDTIFPGNISCRNDHEFIPVDAGTETDVPDPAARNLAANGCSEQHVGQNHIVDVLRPSGYFVAPFLARNRLADDVIRAHLIVFICCSGDDVHLIVFL